jgi:kynurenine formamidase
MNELALYLSNFNFLEPLSLAIPLRFEGAQPNAYGVERASAISCRTEKFVGDTREGGSCNFSQVKLIPHCNGTHTECVGHITHERISLNDCLKDVLMQAVLVSIQAEKANKTNDHYPVLDEKDYLITKKSLEEALKKFPEITESPKLPLALIVRTTPNEPSKQWKTYLNEIPPFFSNEAMLYIRQKGFRHLIVDLPSIDRLYDEGKLSNHRIFWNVEKGSFKISEQTHIHNTVTEFAYISNEIEDGEYLLNLQITAFELEASPSRPILFKKL